MKEYDIRTGHRFYKYNDDFEFILKVMSDVKVNDIVPFSLPYTILRRSNFLIYVPNDAKFGI